ncbi:hypothetical protein EI94DRAFT_1611208, partial [Lactarius quietus]
RMQTAYHPHTPKAAYITLDVKRLVVVENAPTSVLRAARRRPQVLGWVCCSWIRGWVTTTGSVHRSVPIVV